MQNDSGIPIREITKRLRLSRNYIQNAILPHIRHEKSAHGLILVDEKELRQWLKDNAEFSRQTKLISFEDMGAYMSMLSEMKIDSHVPGASLRQRLPFRHVIPFDFWDEKLLFSDDDHFPNAESFFRAMYQCGAIRIKLSERKTMFLPQLQYAAEDLKKDLEDFPKATTIMDIQDAILGDRTLQSGAMLFPAIDETPSTVRAFKTALKQDNVFIDLTGNAEYVEAIVDHLLKIEARLGSVKYVPSCGTFKIEYSKERTAAHIKIPNEFLYAWLHPDELKDTIDTFDLALGPITTKNSLE